MNVSKSCDDKHTLPFYPIWVRVLTLIMGAQRAKQMLHKYSQKKTLVLDLDETLVRSTTSQPIDYPYDYTFLIEINDDIHQVYVTKRPYVDYFLNQIAHLYNVVIFTAGVQQYADVVTDLLGIKAPILYRDSCTFHEGSYVKDLTHLGVDLKDVIIIDNSPSSYQFQPENAIPIKDFTGDQNDDELLKIVPILYGLSIVDDVRTYQS